MSGTDFAGEYRLGERLGQGGMGLVYEAFDRAGAAVAVKLLVLPPGPDEAARLQRFEREAKLAAQIRSPNVVAILGHGVTGAGRPYLVMERLQGLDLAQVLAARKRLEPSEVVIAIGQLGEALDVAHALGIVHRDVKPSNIFLIDEADTTRIKLLDFGVAKQDTADASHYATTTGTTVGTPRYMSPEQILGKRVIDARSDVWSLGVVAYQTLTGHLPFDGESLGALALAIHTVAAPSLRTARPELPEAIDAWFRHACAIDPAHRFESATAAARALAEALDLPASTRGRVVLPSEPPPAERGAARATETLDAEGNRYGASADHRGSSVSRSGSGVVASVRTPVSRGRRWRLAAVVSVALAVGAAGSAWLGWHETSARRIAGRRPAVTVVSLAPADAPAGDTSWASALAEVLSVELSLGESLRSVRQDRVAASAPEAFAGNGGDERPALARIARGTEADYVLHVRHVRKEGDTFDAEVDAFDAARGEHARTFRRSGASIVDVASALGSDVRSWFGVPMASAEERASMHGALPADAEQARAYADGLLHLRRREGEAARAKLEGVVERSADFAPGHWALAQALWLLRYDRRATDEAKRAFELSGSLSREERLRIEGYYRQLANQWSRAIEVDSALANFFPDEPTYAVDLARALANADRGQEGLAVIDRLLARPALAADPNALYARSSVVTKLGQWKEAAETAHRASEAATRMGMRTRSADAKMLESQAWRNLGDEARAVALEGEAELAYDAAQDRRGRGWVLIRRVQQSLARGDVAGVRERAAKAIAFYREVGDPLAEANTITDLASAAELDGAFAEAISHYEDAAKIYRDLGNREGIANTANDVGILLGVRGDLTAATTRLEQAARELAAMDMASNAAGTHAALCAVRLESGDLAGATRVCADAEQLAAKSGDAFARIRVGLAVAAAADAAGDFARGATIRERDLLQGELAKSPGDAVAFAKLDQARTAWRRGDTTEAAKLAIEASAKLETDRAGRARADALAAMALARAGQPREATERVEAARARVETTGDFVLGAWVALADAEVDGAAGRRAAAANRARAVVADARARGFLHVEGDAIAIAARWGGANESDARTLAAQARGRGLVLLASQMDRVAGKP